MDVERQRTLVAQRTGTALESLIATLRSHMARLTSELATHKALLDKLRTLREADKSTLRQKVREVDLLRREEGNIDNSRLGEGHDEDGSPDSRRDTDDYEIEAIQPALVRRALLERTTRTDHATFGSTPITAITGNVGRTRRYVDHNEVEHISVELEERRSE
ncbi:hypothetical protein EDB84DRAFT_166386 [Lactarius hengduanensis]|nr:hypothetical protein EDB84DRAFT_166386 [Lactarius hengduanensis]